MTMESLSWFPYGMGRAPTGLRLFCLPPAGGGASGYRAWPGAFDRRVDVVPVQLPGREGRLSERPVSSAPELVERLVEPVLNHVGGRFALFGHSMGALLADDLAYALSQRGRPPDHLVVSAHLPPHLLHLRRWEPRVTEMSDADLRDYLAEVGGTPRAVLDEPELMELVLPGLRADLELCQSYPYTSRRPLPIPITALGGDADPAVTPELLARWADRTSAAFRMVVLPGGHHYLHEDLAATVDAVSSALLDGITRR
jgi:surfactin synthase thioesterase subunit